MLAFTNTEAIQPESDQDTYSLDQTSSPFWKRSFDLLVAGLVTLLILSWLFPLVGLLIRLTSRGPILYVQLRTGLNGKPFRCLKFRTMRHDFNNVTFRQAVHNDNRITPIGRFLRKTNLDEMPQFLNVLRGHMSIVGPRPHAVQHDAEFWFAIPGYPKRYDVIPGITGLAQVRGARGLTDHPRKMEHRLRYDLFYIRTQSFAQDLLICWWTVKSTLLGDKNAW